MKNQDLRNKRIAVYGGTFNPIHIGHLLTGLDVLEKLHYDAVLYVPASIPVHKKMDYPVDPRHRLRMAEIAVKSYKRFFVSDIEIRKGGYSYTIDTIHDLIKNTQIQKPGVIFGDDLLAGLGQWKQIDELAGIADLICLSRSQTPVQKSPYPMTMIQNRMIEISSSEIRGRIRKGLPVNFMVTEGVKNYIVRHQLYRD